MNNYDHETDGSKKGLIGCFTLLILFSIVVGLPFFVLWLLNLNRTSSGHAPLPYDLTNWIYVAVSLSCIVVLKAIIHKRKMKKKATEQERGMDAEWEES